MENSKIKGNKELTFLLQYFNLLTSVTLQIHAASEATLFICHDILISAETIRNLQAIFLHLCLLVHLSQSIPEKPKRSALNQLTRTLLRKYDCGVRPVHNWTSVTTVYIDLVLQSVLDVVTVSIKINYPRSINLFPSCDQKYS